MIRSTFFRVITVHGKKLQTSLAAPFYSIIKELALTNTPQYQFMTFLLEHL